MKINSRKKYVWYHVKLLVNSFYLGHYTILTFNLLRSVYLLPSWLRKESKQASQVRRIFQGCNVLPILPSLNMLSWREFCVVGINYTFPYRVCSTIRLKREYSRDKMLSKTKVENISPATALQVWNSIQKTTQMVKNKWN